MCPICESRMYVRTEGDYTIKYRPRCHGSGEIRSEVKTYTYDEHGNVKEEIKIVILVCPQCNGMEEY